MNIANDKRSWVVVGIGNECRSDDGVGHYIIHRLANCAELKTLSIRQLTPELAEVLAQCDAVIFVDALITDDATNATLGIQKIESMNDPTMMSHSLAPASLLHLARNVFGHQPVAWLVSIPATNREFGTELSEDAINLAEQAISWIRTNIATDPDCSLSNPSD